MGDLMSLFCISHEGLAERDKRDLVVPSFFVQGVIVSREGCEAPEKLKIVRGEDGEVSIVSEDLNDIGITLKGAR